MHFKQPIIAEDRTDKTVCRRCKKIITYTTDNVQTYYHIGYDTQTIVCPYCKRVHILGYREQFGFDVNNDKRYYLY